MIMIKANELRIGNMVMYHNEIHTLSSMGQWLHTDKSIDEIPLSELKPIIISEQWLLNFGFTKHLEPQDKIIIYNKHQIMNLEWWNDHASFDFGAEKIECKLYFVHQLQNLYFILTGEELQKINIIQ